MNKLKKTTDEFIFESNGFPCHVIKRYMGKAEFYCGYVGVNKDNPWFGTHYNDLEIDCHGGLSYSNFLIEDSTEFWFFGFDCAHIGDYIPGFELKSSLMEACKKFFNSILAKNPNTPERLMLNFEEVERDICYVIDQCESIAKQFADMQLTSE